jgi:hypothetical protein
VLLQVLVGTGDETVLREIGRFNPLSGHRLRENWNPKRHFNKCRVFEQRFRPRQDERFLFDDQTSSVLHVKWIVVSSVITLSHCGQEI